MSRRENGIHKRLADSLGTVFGHRDSFTRILNTDAACLYRQVEKKNTKYNLLFLSLPIIIRSPFCTLHDWLSITKAILTVRLEFFQAVKQLFFFFFYKTRFENLLFFLLKSAAETRLSFFSFQLM